MHSDGLNVLLQAASILDEPKRAGALQRPAGRKSTQSVVAAALKPKAPQFKGQFTVEHRKRMVQAVMVNMAEEDQKLARDGLPHQIDWSKYARRNYTSPFRKAYEALKAEDVVFRRDYRAMRKNMLHWFMVSYTSSSEPLRNKKRDALARPKDSDAAAAVS